MAGNDVNHKRVIKIPLQLSFFIRWGIRVRSEGYILFRGWEFSKVRIATEGKGGGEVRQSYTFFTYIPYGRPFSVYQCFSYKWFARGCKTVYNK